MAVTLADGETLRARDLVLAMALEQSVPFLRNLRPASGAGGGVDSALGVMEMFASIPCLTLIAGYDPGVPRLDWDICYPEDEPALLLMSNESSKRTRAPFLVVVFQASARWSMERLARPKEEWGRELLDVVSRRLGSCPALVTSSSPNRW